MDQFCLPAQPTMSSALVTADNSLIHLSVSCSNLPQVTKILKLRLLKQRPIPDPEGAFHLFRAEKHGLKFGVDFHPQLQTAVR